MYLLLALLLAEISGVVVDPSDAAIAGARVSLRPESGGKVRTARTDVSGRFRFPLASAGAHRLEVQAEGFQTARIGAAGPGEIRIMLNVADLSEQITVSARAAPVVADPRENLDSVRLERDLLDNLPVLDQDVIAAAGQFLDPGAVGSGGVNVVVDGMPTSEPGVSSSAIEDVRINQNPYSAEFARPGRGRIEVTTQSGSAGWHGTLNALLRDHRLAARHAFAERRPQEQRRILEGHLSGPLGRSKKTTFLASANREEQERASVVYALTPPGIVRENFPSPERETLFSLRLNHQRSPASTMALRYEFERDAERGKGAGGLRLPEAAFDAAEGSHHVYLNHRGIPTPRVVNDIQIRLGRHRAWMRSRTTGVPRIVVPGAFTGGSAQVDASESEHHLDLHQVLSWSPGRHLVRAGFSVPEFSRRASYDRSNFGGTFSFASLEDYLAGRPYAYAAQQGDGRLVFWQKQFAAFLQDDIRLRPNLSVAAGLRYDWQNYLADHNNFGPRVSLAYAPGRQRRTVLRAGAGCFYDETGDEPIADLLRYDGRRLRQVFVSNPGYPDPGPLATRAPNLVRFAPGLRSPYTLHWSFGIDRRLGRSTGAAVTYSGARGVKLFRSRDVNAPAAPHYLRPDPALGMIRQIESSAGLEGRSLEVALRGSMTRVFQGMVQYTLGRYKNDTDGINSLPADHYDLSGEWSRATWEERHRFRLLGSVQPGRWFRFGVSLSLRSGRPYSLTTGEDHNRDTIASDRPPGVPRNTLEAPGAATVDLRWSKEFSTDGGLTVTIGADAFNLLNRVNYNEVVGNLSSPLFGQAVSADSPRRVQLTLRVKF
jgi:hypothetical protein